MNKPADTKVAFQIDDASLRQLAAASEQATQRGQAAIRASLQTWEAEVGRYFEEFSAHSLETLEALGHCESPLDVLSVEQKWMHKRAQAYIDSGMRFAQAFASAARSVAGEQAQG
jgi:hypothetical protein